MESVNAALPPKEVRASTASFLIADHVKVFDSARANEECKKKRKARRRAKRRRG